MNFYRKANKAKKNSFWLVVLFIVSSILTTFLTTAIIIVFFALLGEGHLHNLTHRFEMNDIVQISVAVFTTIFAISAEKIIEFSRGGRVIAEILRGKIIHKDTPKQEEKMVLNIVEEMAISTGIHSIAVYLLPSNSINAFTSGLTVEDAVIGVTKGAIEKLTRQELQAVVAHEFSHIFNGDMRLNIKITAILHGILAIGTIGIKILSSLSSLYTLLYPQARYKVKKNEIYKLLYLPLLAPGAVLFMVGLAGMLIGSIIKYILFKQREYLADTSAVKYTRDDSGILGALKKIAKDTSATNLPSINTYNHFFFVSGTDNLWDFGLPVHPTLQERIYHIDPSWDGNFTTHTPSHDKNDKHAKTIKQKATKLYKTLNATLILSEIEKVQMLLKENFILTRNIQELIPKQLYQMTQNSFSAQGLILGLLASYQNEVSQNALTKLQNDNPKLYKKVQKVFHLLSDISKDHYLILLQLSLPTLKETSASQYSIFRELCLEWIYSNQQISLFEWILKYILLSPLDIFFHLSYPKPILYESSEKLVSEIAFFGSFLATLSTDDICQAKEKYENALMHIGLKSDFITTYNRDFTLFDEIFEKLLRADFGVKKTLLKLATICLSKSNKTVSKHDQMILQALALSFHIPFNLYAD